MSVHLSRKAAIIYGKKNLILESGKEPDSLVNDWFGGHMESSGC